MAGIIGGVLGVGANIAGGLAGAAASSGDINAGQGAIQDAYNKLAAIGLPPDEAKAIIYNQYKQAGILTPEIEHTINQGPSKMAGVTGNADAQKAQMQALQILQQTGQTGMTPQSQAALNQIRQQVAADTNAKQQSIQQQFAARGQGGSGAQLIGQLQAAQSGANQESTAGDQIGAMAAQNALQAIGQAGTLGGQIQGQQFGEQAQKAQAQDVINQFNTANQVGQQARNVGSQNAAQQYNLGNAQQLSNANTQQSNQELLRQNQAQRQQYLDNIYRATKINDAANGYGEAMTHYGQMAGQAAAAPWQAVGAGLTSAGGALSGGSSGGSNRQQAQGGFSGNDPMAGATQIAYAGGEILPRFNQGGDISDYQGGQYTDYRDGGPVDGRAEVAGDNPKNDTVKAMLSPGEMVVPRTLAKSPFGKKLAKLLELHHEVMDHQKHGDPNNE